jgi:uncharacterized membrane protein YgcG
VRRWSVAWLSVLCLSALSAAHAADAALQPVPPQTALLVDQAGALDEIDRQALTLRLQEIQGSGRAQVAILIARDTQGEALSDYALRVAENWKLGRAGRDDGLLILLVPSENKARIEVGYGLEGDIPDARASQWLDDFLPAMKDGQLTAALVQLLDKIDAALPTAAAPATADNVLDRHPEWKLPFVLAVFSPFALFPLFFGRWGALASAPLLAAFIGGAAWALWHTQMPALIIAGVALSLPPLWSLNWTDSGRLSPALRIAKGFGNLIAVLVFFSVITLFVGVGLSVAAPDELWGAPLFAGMLALGLAVFLFPGAPARVLMILLRSLMHFVFVLILAFAALQDRVAAPGALALEIALAFTACVALSLYLDSREQAAKSSGSTPRRWSLVLVALALLMVLPIGLLLLVQGALGDSDLRLAQAGAGGGSILGVLWWAARAGFFAAARIGLGGRFGGGGAGR